MSLHTTFQRSSNLARRCLASTAAFPKPPVPEAIIKKNDFKTNYLSDPSTYPLFGVMAAATAIVIVFTVNMVNYKNWKIMPSSKHETLEKDSTRTKKPITEIVSREPITFHPQAMKDTRAEKKGLGVEHQEILNVPESMKPSD
ncbi:hypothetical protein FisN_20Lu061 [Fistulifera solaris]|uniref:Uncharacterized protein n=1 Tax=Fistulifera solaris TaxID=1519565 RepID=A0A1Z5JDP0_FISSO|nr:hypothetical protein FisN_20Lu061 [Fistulifera solaris]|eukprot:GAX11881.1 hypothetical protein FisN_20Lu061 [Fistulifera solaris]